MGWLSTTVTIITGICARRGSLLSLRRTVQPSDSGMITSNVITNGLASRASRRPSSPLAAATARKPSLVRKRDIRSRTAGSSSITRIVSSSGLCRDDPAAAAPAASDCAASAGSSVLARDRCIGLRELLKKFFLLFGADADARIFDAKSNPLLSFHGALAYIQGDRSVIRELAGVAHQVE